MARVNRKASLGSDVLSLAEARRISVHAQGFGGDPSPPTRPSLLRTIKQIGLLQLDSVNVLVRSHYLPLYSRLGPYAPETLDALSHRSPRALFEYWGHEASLIPVDFHPLFRWRMERARRGSNVWGGLSRFAKARAGFVAAVLNEVKDRGPIGAGELADGGKSTGNWWGWSEGKRALEYLFWTGQLTSAGRRGFERLYDLPERIIPLSTLRAPTPDEALAQRNLVERAASALGIAIEADLRDYFRLDLADARERVAELVEEGVLRRVSVEGWKQHAYLHTDAKLPPQIDACALLSPFDSLIWMRPRTDRLFNFHYRLAFYTPKHKRKQGYYVTPFLLGDRLVARVDLKSDRKNGRLLVLGGHVESGAALAKVVAHLGPELSRIAHWLGLAKVAHRGRGELVAALRRA